MNSSVVLFHIDLSLTKYGNSIDSVPDSRILPLLYICLLSRLAQFALGHAYHIFVACVSGNSLSEYLRQAALFKTSALA